MRYRFLFAASFMTTHAMAQQESTHHIQHPKGSSEDYLYATQPEGKSLPAGMVRVRLPYQISRGSWGYDKDGNKQELVTATGRGGAFIAEYGLTDKISLQTRWDYVVSQDIELNKDAFRDTDRFSSAKSAAYAQTFASLSATNQAELETAVTGVVAKEAAAAGLCNSEAACLEQIKSGTLKTPSTGYQSSNISSLQIAGNTSFASGISQFGSAVDAQISNGILDAAADLAHYSGAKGGGDLTVGALYEVYAEKPLFFSIAGGVRFPTGKYRSIALDELPTGRGLTELGIRTDVDVLPLDALMVSWENQAEGQIAKGRVEVGDEEKDVERSGIRHNGFVYVKPSLVPLHSSLNVLAPRIGITYDYDSEERIDGKATGRSQIIKQAIGLGLDLTRLDIPVQLDVDYTQPWKGRDIAVATSDLTTTLKLFAVF